MYAEYREYDAYPYTGVFYVPVDNKNEDGDLLQDNENTYRHVTDEEVILETPCDILESTKGWTAGAITASFNVYFPFDKEEGFPVRRGMMFRSEAFTMPVNGTVAGIVPSQLGGCIAYIKDVNV